MYLEQAAYRVRFERGERGLRAVAGGAGVIVIVDVLSFSTAVDIAVTAGAAVLPTSQVADGHALAERYGALLAVPRADVSESTPYTLSPDSLAGLPSGARLILPSPNGATLVAIAREFGAMHVVAGCLRNASAVAVFVRERANAKPVAVIAAGERWADGSLRVALEDDLGAGAILSVLNLNEASPEACYVAHGFSSERASLKGAIRSSVSGRELIDFGYPQDVERAIEYDVSRAVPLAGDDGFITNAA